MFVSLDLKTEEKDSNQNDTKGGDETLSDVKFWSLSPIQIVTIQPTGQFINFPQQNISTLKFNISAEISPEYYICLHLSDPRLLLHIIVSLLFISLYHSYCCLIHPSHPQMYRRILTSIFYQSIYLWSYVPNLKTIISKQTDICSPPTLPDGRL